MSRSYYPSAVSDLSVWATNYKTKIANYAAELELTPDQVRKEQDFCDALIASINNVASKRAELRSALNARITSNDTDGGALRREISRHKIASGYSEAIGQDLGIISQTPIVDFANYKAKITAELYGGLVRIKFKKNYADGVNLYNRKKGDIEWNFVARATKSPFEHIISLQVPGQPEHWEYRAFGVVDDTEVGIASDIVEIIYAV